MKRQKERNKKRRLTKKHQKRKHCKRLAHKAVKEMTEMLNQFFEKSYEESKQEKESEDNKPYCEKTIELPIITFCDNERTYKKLDREVDKEYFLKDNDNIVKPKYSKRLFEVRLYKGKMKRKKR